MANPSAPALDDHIIHTVNGDKSSSWQAHRNLVFEGQTVADVQKRLGVRDVYSLQQFKDSLQQVHQSRSSALPRSFDWRIAMPGCVHPIRNQGKCGR